jgi:hypothetical protein
MVAPEDVWVLVTYRTHWRRGSERVPWRLLSYRLSKGLSIKMLSVSPSLTPMTNARFSLCSGTHRTPGDKRRGELHRHPPSGRVRVLYPRPRRSAKLGELRILLGRWLLVLWPEGTPAAPAAMGTSRVTRLAEGGPEVRTDARLPVMALRDLKSWASLPPRREPFSPPRRRQMKRES